MIECLLLCYFCPEYCLCLAGHGFLPSTLAVTGPAKVWGQFFSDRLGIRPRSQHATCGICKKHKMILKRLANTRARAGQMKEYVRRLKRTYADRVQYWQARSTSRLFFLPCGRRSFCMITDGMDRSKFKLPRSRIMTTKEFDSFSRPSLDMSAMITHGHSCVIAISGPRVGKGSSWVVDLFANALHRLADQHDFCRAIIAQRRRRTTA